MKYKLLKTFEIGDFLIDSQLEFETLFKVFGIDDADLKGLLELKYICEANPMEKRLNKMLDMRDTELYDELNSIDVEEFREILRAAVYGL